MTALDDAVVKWFDRRGLTLLLAGTPLARTTRERAVPVLVAWFLLVMLLLVPLTTTLDLVAAFGLGAGALVAAWVIGNLFRRRRPLTPVRDLGPFEALVFVLLPAVAVGLGTANAAFNSLVDPDIDAGFLRLIVVGSMLALQVVALGVILGLERMGLVTLGVWLSRTLFASMATTGSALATSLPVSLGVVFFFFLNPGVWGSIGTLPPVPYLAVIALLLLLAAAFLGSNRHLGLESLTHFEDAPSLSSALADGPLEGAETDTIETPASCPLGPLQRFCLTQVAILSQLVIGLLIALVVFCLFVVIGYLAVDPGTVTAWTRAAPTVLVSYAGAAHHYILSVQHLRVAGFLAAFTAFNYSLASATDARLRHNTRETASEVVRQACAMRLVLLGGRLPVEA